MSAITRFVLNHKLVVLVLWLGLAVAGAFTAGPVATRLTSSFGMPGPAFDAEGAIIARYHSGVTDPVVPVITPRRPGRRLRDDRRSRLRHPRRPEHLRPGERPAVQPDGRYR